jgi:hypothetical protein
LHSASTTWLSTSTPALGQALLIEAELIVQAFASSETSRALLKAALKTEFR